jgi:hypothetical protein
MSAKPSRFGQDENSVFKRLEDGRVLRLHERLFNTLLTVSESQESMWWSGGW